MNEISHAGRVLAFAWNNFTLEAAKPYVDLFIVRIKDVALYYATPQVMMSLGVSAIILPIATIGISVVAVRALHNASTPTNLLPKWTWHVMKATTFPGDIFLTVVHKTIVTFIPSLKKSKMEEMLFSDLLSPILEEVEWRWFVQQICFTVAPTLILNTLAPGYGPLVYHPAAKVCRIVLTAGLFALSHTNNWGQGANPWCPGGIFPQFISGLSYGALTEYHQGVIVYSAVSHCVHNFVVDFL